MVEPAPLMIGKENVDEHLPGGDTRPGAGPCAAASSPGVPVTPVDRVAAASPSGVGSGPEGQAQPPRGAPMVEGYVPDRRRLLLDVELFAGHRGAGRRGGIAPGDVADRGFDAARDAADVSAGRGGEPQRSGVGGHAGEAAAVLVGKAVRAD